MKKKRRRVRRKKRSFVKGLLSVLLFCVLLTALAGAAGVLYIASTAEPIITSNIYSQIDQTSYIYDRDGELIDEIHYGEDRKVLSSEEMPITLKNAVVAIEDKTFYKHHGFNLKRMVGAVLSKLLGKSDSISGTSTITQQLARNVFLSDVKSERTIKRKATEMYYAWQLERDMSKDAILEAYLNTIYLGYSCYGVDSAARTYFSKDAKDLSLAECAALAALPQAPDAYALIKDEAEESDYAKPIEGSNSFSNDISRARRELVLDLMAEQGYISQAEADEAKVDVASFINPDFGRKTSSLTYFTDYVVSEVTKDLADERGLTNEEADRLVHTGGLHIYSTIDTDVQKIIDTEFKDDSNFPSCQDGETTPQASMVITEVGTGHIIAMSGGRGNPKGHQLFNRAISPRQPGSSIKPLSVYSAALQKSYELQKDGKEYPFEDFGYDKQGKKYWGKYITAGSYIADEKMTVNGNVWPNNANRKFTGRQTFRTALQQSINTCAVKIELQVGTEYSIGMLRKYGISTVVSDVALPTNDVNQAALALGAMTYGTTPLDMAIAYGTFPNEGVCVSPACYTEVSDSKGNTILEKVSAKTDVINKGVAWIMTDILKSAVSRGIASNAAISGTEVGGKTGTTNDNYDIWFCGFTPKYSAALWIGTDKNKTMNATSSTAALLWSKIVGQMEDSTEGVYPEKPASVITYGGEYYTKGTEGGAYYPKKKKSESSDNNSAGSQNSSGSSGNNDSSGNSSRQRFVQNFNGESSGSSDSSSGASGSPNTPAPESVEPSGGGARDQWLRDWQNSN